MSSIEFQKTRVMLAELLANEKDATRVWLRAEMDRLVDPMLDSIFNRIQTKLTNGLERTHSGDGELMSSTEHELPNVNLSQSYPVNTQPSTLNPQSNHQPPSIDYEPENDPEILAEVKRQIEEERQMQLNMQNNNQIDNEQIEGNESINFQESPIEQGHKHHQFQTNSTSTECCSHYTKSTHALRQMTNDANDTDRMESDKPEVKEEFDETFELSNENQFLVQSAEEANKETSKETSQGQSSSYATESNQQSNHGIIEHIQTLPDKLRNGTTGRNQFGNGDECGQLMNPIAHDQVHDAHLPQSVALINDEECECGDCVNGGIEKMMNEDEGDSVDCFEDNIELEQSPQPVKKARLDTTQPNNAQSEVNGECSRRATQPNQVNNQDKQIITVSLICPQCSIDFTKDQFDDHMLEEHDIGSSRCLVKDCSQSFDNKRSLGEHIKNAHPPTTQLHCHKCPKHYTKYHNLYSHTIQLHQLGNFQCSFPSCTFTAECRGNVYSHYAQQHKHKHKQTFYCQHSACQYRAQSARNLKQHEQMWHQSHIDVNGTTH